MKPIKNCIVLLVLISGMISCQTKQSPREVSSDGNVSHAQSQSNEKSRPIVEEKADALEKFKDNSRAEAEGISQANKPPMPPSKMGYFYDVVEDDLEEEPQQRVFNTEAYNRIYENTFLSSLEKPLSTFSIDVDAASYSNTRRFINSNQLPPPDAVRIEELINYFQYNYKESKAETPFSITTEIATCPWNSEHQLVHVGLQGKKMATETLPPTNLVFLLDVSGSMDDPDKLPLLKSAFGLLVDQLRPQDRVAVVVYAGAAGLVLPSTTGSNKNTILEAIEKLDAGGSTAGGEGIELAYKVALEHFIKGGNNRVVLATDGDFNIGASSDGALVRMIEEKRKTGIYLTVLGFGTGNYKDSKMEQLADKGNGNYAYIDGIMEAKKVLVNELGATFFTIAKDVKIQVEFNPSLVKGYRLIGYENRLLQDRDFNDDTKDAGEMGAGHSVTALYEIIPAGSTEEIASVDPLRYQSQPQERLIDNNGEVMTIKLRYKKPNEEKSRLLTQVLKKREMKKLDQSLDFMFAASVAEFGLLLRQSQFLGMGNYKQVLRMAKASKGADLEGYRAEFIRLVETASLLNRQ